MAKIPANQEEIVTPQITLKVVDGKLQIHALGLQGEEHAIHMLATAITTIVTAGDEEEEIELEEE